MLNRVIGIRISIVSEWYLSSQLRSTRLPHTDLAVSRLFTSPGNSIGDMLLCVIRSKFRSATERRSFEARMIFGHRTLEPAGLNVDFNFICRNYSKSAHACNVSLCFDLYLNVTLRVLFSVAINH